jgi:hypothetical protein
LRYTIDGLKEGMLRRAFFRKLRCPKELLCPGEFRKLHACQERHMLRATLRRPHTFAKAISKLGAGSIYWLRQSCKNPG